ncbi:MAG: hypothetical protein M3530_03615 [Thermoproteota archaeon]|nr:hypothetical protein [Thermoproteota archaeon]
MMKMIMTNFDKKKEILVLLIAFGLGFSTSLSTADQYLPVVSAQGAPIPGCNCTADYIATNPDNLTAMTIPRLNIVKTEILDSQTEGHLTWKAIKSTVLMNVITDNFLLANFSTGTGSTVALNTINVKPNESLGIQLSGKIPDAARAEIVRASVNENGTMKDVKPVEKIHEYELQYDKATKKLVSGKNDLVVNLDEPGYYLVVISLSFGSHHGNNINKTTGLTGVYETLLKVE